MRILLLGPNGQLGSDIQRAAVAHQSLELVPVGRDRLDVTRLPEIKSTLAHEKFDALIYCIGYHKTDDVEKNPQLAVTVNAHAAKELAELCRDRDAKLVYISTDYVWRGDATRPYVETDRIGPLNVYGASKAMGESLVLSSGASAYVLRVASLFGLAGASGKGGNFVELMLRLAKEKGELKVVDEIRMSPTSTADVAECLLRMLERSPAPGIYHVVNSGDATWCEFAREIVQAAGVDVPVHPLTNAQNPTAAVRPNYSVMDNAKVGNAVMQMPHWRDALDRYLRAKGHVGRNGSA